jgi:hypothetical protein
MLVSLHETATHRTPGKVEPLQNPNASHQNNQGTDEATDESHDSIEHSEQNAPLFLFLASQNKRHRQNSPTSVLGHDRSLGPTEI